MAIYLDLDKRQTNAAGLVPLKRGDDWKILGQIVEKYAKYSTPLDLTSSSATAYFEAATGGTLTKDVALTDEACGKVRIDVGLADTTDAIALAENGTTIYCVIDHPSLGRITADMASPVIEIKDREFAEP